MRQQLKRSTERRDDEEMQIFISWLLQLQLRHVIRPRLAKAVDVGVLTVRRCQFQLLRLNTAGPALLTTRYGLLVALTANV